MKKINQLNYLMMGFLLIMAFIGLLYEETFIYITIWSVIPICLFQFISALVILLMTRFKNIYIKIYLLGVIIFLTLWISTDWKWISAIPLALMLYMSAILFFIEKKENHEY